MLHQQLSEQIIRSFYLVYRELGNGFLEKVYERALFLELQEMRLQVQAQSQIKVFYKGQLIGDYFADLLVNEQIIVEVKSVADISEFHKNQLRHYLKATEIELGLLLNFGPEPQISRQIFTNDRK